ncbi:MAG TPA: SDR family oxidoreductase [Flavisolibacter sp.]|nr:SDR family oxidoreductase [Flavisolibacter sp.]
MKKVILFGSSGNLGKQIAAELHRQGYEVTAVVRNMARSKEMALIAPHTLVADVTNPAALSGICSGFGIVVSALGKSVSPNERSKPSFLDIDFGANNAILQEAIHSGVRKFVYVSALGAENYLHLAYFRAHHLFSEKLKGSGLDYAIIKPPALFSAFVDLIDLAKKGRLVTMGRGEKITNPIYEGDLAKICVAAIDQPNAEIEAGGKEMLSRGQINDLIQRIVDPGKKVRHVPLGVVKAALPLLKLTARNLYDKIAFFAEVMQHDTVAPAVGETRLADYIKTKAKS